MKDCRARAYLIADKLRCARLSCLVAPFNPAPPLPARKDPRTRSDDSRRAGATTRGRFGQGLSSLLPPPPSPSISRNRSLSLGHLHGNSWVHLHTSRGVRPEARIETTSLPRRTRRADARGGRGSEVSEAGRKGQEGGRRMRRLAENPFCEYWR